MDKKITKLPPKIMAAPKLLDVAGYARVSADKLAMIESLSAQVSYYSEKIQSTPGWRFAGVYTDEALTGTKAKRPEFQRLLQDCRDGKVGMVVTKSISRFGRDVVALLSAARELKTLGIDIWFEREDLHTLSHEGELMLTLLAGFAQEESRSVSDNCKWRVRKDFQQGILNPISTYGYRYENGKPAIEPLEAEAVRCIFGFHNQHMGYSAIARELDQLGYEPPITEKWNALTIRYILRNARYAGEVVLQKTFVADHLTKRRVRNRGELPQYHVTDVFPAIICQNEFKLAQGITAASLQRFTPAKANEMSTAWSGKILCDRCGKPYKRKVAHGKASWNCGTFMRKGKAHCHGKQIPEDTLIALAAEVLDGSKNMTSQARIESVTIPAPNVLVFHLSDGSGVERTWTDRSRAESWNDAMKEQARQHTTKRWTK